MTKVSTIAAPAALEVIRADKLEVGRRYNVDIHGLESKNLTLRSKPDVSISKMTAEDAFIFETGGRSPKQVVFRSHMNEGPKFLVTEVESQRGTRKARVTFRTKVKAAQEIVEPAKKAA